MDLLSRSFWYGSMSVWKYVSMYALSILTRVTCTTAHATQQIANPVVRTKSLNLIWICYPRLTVKICRKKIKKNNSRFSRRYVLLTRVTCITTHATQQIANPVVRTKSLNLIWICYQRYNIGKKFFVRGYNVTNITPGKICRRLVKKACGSL